MFYLQCVFIPNPIDLNTNQGIRDIEKQLYLDQLAVELQWFT